VAQQLQGHRMRPDMCNHLPNYYDLAAGSMATYGHRPNLGPQLRFALAKTRQMIHALSSDGVSQQGICYGGFYTDYLARTVDLVNQLLANDLFASSEWLANTRALHQYGMIPQAHWARRNHLMGFGDGMRYHWQGPDCWVIVHDLAAREASTFEALFHSDHPFRRINDLQWATGGESGALQLTCLAPADARIDCETQIAAGIGAHGHVPTELLRIRNGEAASECVFVTLLEAHRVGDAPLAAGVVGRDGASLTVDIEIGGKRYAIRLGALGKAAPVLVTTG